MTLVGAFSVIVKTDGSFAALVWAKDEARLYAAQSPILEILPSPGQHQAAVAASSPAPGTRQGVFILIQADPDLW